MVVTNIEPAADELPLQRLWNRWSFVLVGRSPMKASPASCDMPQTMVSRQSPSKR